MDLRKEVGFRLRLARERSRFTQTAVAKRLGIHNSTLGKYELGEREADHETMVKLSEIYDVDLNWIMKGEERTEGNTNIRNYDDFLSAIKKKYPNINIDNPSIRRRLMKAVDLVLEDLEN